MTVGARPTLSREARRTVARMGEAAVNFLAALGRDQRALATFEFADEDERTRWYYTPNERRGLPLNETDRHQRRLAMQLVATGLSGRGFALTATIMGLEQTLDAVESWKRADWVRDPLRYYISFFDEPDPKRPWGWRFEGHHVSLNYTIVAGRIVAPTPTFFGANPAEIELEGTGTLRPLAGTEDIARELMRALDEGQRAAATLAPAAPPDIVMANRPRVVEGALPIPAEIIMGRPMTDAVRRELEHERARLGLTDAHLEALRYTAAPKGLAAAALNAAQREILSALVRAYIDRMPDEIAEIEIDRLNRSLDTMHFAWAGGMERRQPHYYRLQGTRCLIEYDNTQNDANHVHSVWRDPDDDFGADLLARHYNQDHGIR